MGRKPKSNNSKHMIARRMLNEIQKNGEMLDYTVKDGHWIKKTERKIRKYKNKK